MELQPPQRVRTEPLEHHGCLVMRLGIHREGRDSSCPLVNGDDDVAA